MSTDSNIVNEAMSTKCMPKQTWMEGINKDMIFANLTKEMNLKKPERKKDSCINSK